jgi:cobalt-zinc-cadmium efflux system protein
VIVAALVVQLTGFLLADTIAGLGIAAFVLPRTWRLGRRALRVLLQAAPEDVDPAAVADELGELPHVAEVHDVHVWTLTSGIDVATAHLHLDTPLSAEDSHDLLDAAHGLLRDHHGLDHATVQLEPPSHEQCDPHAQWSTQ